MHRFLRPIVEKAFAHGNLTLIEPDGGEHRYGNGDGPPIVVEIRAEQVERQVAIDPTLKLGEAYMNGDIIFRKGTIYDFLDTVYQNIHHVGDTTLVARILDLLRFSGRRLRQLNNIRRSSQNVQHHYDISNDLYRLFLDEDMQYSCAYFEHEDQSLDEAQLAKKRHIAAKLLVEPGQSVLDIGCGWGGLGLYLADLCEADVTGVTLSKEQLKLANERAARRGLSERARFEERDYRSLDSQVDRIVSVGMFEHVGVNNFGTFFRKSHSLLKDDGVMLLHSIGRSEGPGITNPFIEKYIFPGGYIPALSEVLPHIEKAGFLVTDVEILRLHYADTLREWRHRFLANADRLGEGYDDRFRRMWEFYLVGSEIAFRRQGMMVFQIQLAKDQNAVPLTRTYIGDAERRLAGREARKTGHRRTDPANDRHRPRPAA